MARNEHGISPADEAGRGVGVLLEDVAAVADGTTSVCVCLYVCVRVFVCMHVCVCLCACMCARV